MKKQKFVLSNEKGEKIVNPTKEQTKEILVDLECDENSFAILEIDDNNYMQAGGGPDDFIVEVRCNEGDEFKHYKAKEKGVETNEKMSFRMSEGKWDEYKNVIFPIQMVIQLFEGYLDGIRLHEYVAWFDMTDRFTVEN